eukprot:1741521-Heterocapsa_arctica.AAC.1
MRLMTSSSWSTVSVVAWAAGAAPAGPGAPMAFAAAVLRAAGTGSTVALSGGAEVATSSEGAGRATGGALGLLRGAC